MIPGTKHTMDRPGIIAGYPLFSGIYNNLTQTRRDQPQSSFSSRRVLDHSWARLIYRIVHQTADRVLTPALAEGITVNFSAVAAAEKQEQSLHCKEAKLAVCAPLWSLKRS